MSYPLCSVRGREHINRPPLPHPRRHRRRFHPPVARGVAGVGPTLNRRKALTIRSGPPPGRTAAVLRHVLGACLIEPSSRMGGRVVDCARLESVCAAMHRGFESLPIRHSAAGGLKTKTGMRTKFEPSLARRPECSEGNPSPSAISPEGVEPSGSSR